MLNSDTSFPAEVGNPEGQDVAGGLFGRGGFRRNLNRQKIRVTGGDKRAGLLCAVVFLDINGISLDYPDDRLYQAMIDIANKKSDKKSFADLLKELFLWKK